MQRDDDYDWLTLCAKARLFVQNKNDNNKVLDELDVSFFCEY